MPHPADRRGVLLQVLAAQAPQGIDLDRVEVHAVAGLPRGRAEPERLRLGDAACLLRRLRSLHDEIVSAWWPPSSEKPLAFSDTSVSVWTPRSGETSPTLGQSDRLTLRTPPSGETSVTPAQLERLTLRAPFSGETSMTPAQPDRWTRCASHSAPKSATPDGTPGAPPVRLHRVSETLRMPRSAARSTQRWVRLTESATLASALIPRIAKPAMCRSIVSLRTRPSRLMSLSVHMRSRTISVSFSISASSSTSVSSSFR